MFVFISGAVLLKTPMFQGITVAEAKIYQIYKNIGVTDSDFLDYFLVGFDYF